MSVPAEGRVVFVNRLGQSATLRVDSATAVSRIVVPARRVARNASSSPYAYCEIRSYSFATSGYDGAMQSRATGSSSGIAGSS